jgi:serine/threonine protein kinase
MWVLAELHDQDKWHRDLHPGNLFLLADQPVIGDFGLVDFPGKEPVTGDTEQIGARNYVAPEMRRNAGQQNLFDALDAKSVNLVLLFLVPAGQFQKHVNTLADIAKLLHRQDFRDGLWRRFL